jgi:hypothetical protein
VTSEAFAPRAGDSAVRPGHVFRADGLAQLTDRSRADIRALGIRTVLDLRDIGERSKLPDALDGLEVDHIELPVFDDHFFPQPAAQPRGDEGPPPRRPGWISPTVLWAGSTNS